jgi:hypothetical protein
MPKGKLSPEGEVIAAYGAAMVAAFQVLINCLEENDALLPGAFPNALRVYMEMVKSRKGDVSDMTLLCSATFGRLRWISCLCSVLYGRDPGRAVCICGSPFRGLNPQNFC